MKLFGKKAMSLFLAFVMAFSMCSVAAFAEESYTLTLSKSTLTLQEGKDAELTATVTPDEDAPDVVWESSDEDVVTVDGKSDWWTPGGSNSGNTATVTAVGAGEATVTAYLEGHKDVKATCTVTVTSDKPFKVEPASGEKKALEVPYGTTKTDVIKELKKIKFDFYYGSKDDPTVVQNTISDWACAKYDKEELDEYTFTSEIEGEGRRNTITVECTVEVVAAKVTKQEYTKTVKVPTGLDEDEIIDILEATVEEVTVTANGLTIKLDANDSSIFKGWAADKKFDKKYENGNKFTFTKSVSSKFRALENLEDLEVTVEAGNEDVGTLAYAALYEADGVNEDIDLNEIIEDGIEAYLKANKRKSENKSYKVYIPNSARVDYGDLERDENRYGEFEYTYRFPEDDKGIRKLERALEETGYVLENDISFQAQGDGDGQIYEGKLRIQIINGSFDIEAECTGKTFDFQKKIVNEIIKNLKSAYGSSAVLDFVDFSSINDEGGTLYESSAKNAYEVDTRTHYYYNPGKNQADLTKLYYVPEDNGKSFTAYYDAYGTKDGQYITGLITIGNPESLALEVNIANTETYKFSAKDLQAAVAELDKSYTLDYIKFDSASASYGKMYAVYDGEKSKNNESLSTKEEYYVSSDYRNDYLIDDVTFVPDTNRKNVSTTIKFNAYVVYGKNNRETETIPGVLTINIQQEADITYKTGVNTAITFSAEDFVNFLKKNVSGTNLNLASVEFDGLPTSTTLGYMYDGAVTSYNRNYISKPDKQTYYYKPSNNSRMDLNNLTWLAGSKVGTQHVEFTVHYTKGNSTKEYDKTGALDLVTENSVTVKQTIKASELYQKFQSDMKSAGASYVEFTSVTGGKLMYNFCKSNQEAVKTGTYYYVSGTGAQKQLSDVSFVPAYGATTGKVTMKAYDNKNTCIIFEYQFTITAVNGSAYFNDITAYSYGNYAKSIDLLFSLGIVQGNSTTSRQYNPTGTLTRGEWITMLYRAAGSPAVYGTNSFTDVPSWCKDAVQWAVANNITTGTSATTFEPSMQLDRRQIALFLYRWAQKLGLDTTGTVNLSLYTDGSTVPSWASAAMQWALKNGYLDTVNGMVKPLDYTTRAVIADSLHRVLVK